jgi:DNA-binding NarL/FixJ family response regulator
MGMPLASAFGYLLKRLASYKLLEAIEEVCTGGSPMSCQIARKVVQFFHHAGPAENGGEDLTPREREILDLLVAGCFFKEIADRLGISGETVRTHVNHIYGKIHVRSRTEAVVKYLRTK